jgi:hypothetical protein
MSKFGTQIREILAFDAMMRTGHTGRAAKCAYSLNLEVRTFFRHLADIREFLEVFDVKIYYNHDEETYKYSKPGNIIVGFGKGSIIS